MSPIFNALIKSLIRIILTVILLFLIGIGLIVYFTHHPIERDIPFNASLWKAETEQCSFYSISNRNRMAKDLARIVLATPMEPQQILSLLGEPDFWFTENHWGYHAGTSTMDCMTFDIYISDNRVTDARLVQH